VLPARPATVLVVEDDRTLRTFYQSALMIAGFHVLTAEDGVEALRKVEGYGPAALVLDLGLPRMSGRDVQRELLAHDHLRNIPIVVVTGSDSADIDDHQFTCVLRKPVSAEALIMAVTRCLTERSES
jgi:CheY-like chemotaxis protein